MDMKKLLEKEIGGFPAAPAAAQGRSNQLAQGFTLLELIMVIVVIGILASIAVPNYFKAKNRAIGKEAISNLKLIAAAERIYKMENNAYATCTCTNPSNCAAASGCNYILKLILNTTNWRYTVTGSASSVNATATYQSGSSCKYNIDSSDFDAEPVKSGGSGCP